MTLDDASMERSKSFVTALQELKNLRPQLYSAAEYCETSYLHSEQKQMVLDHLKDYAVQALVNAIDHLGTVAYKLSDVLEQQTLDISSIDLKVTCINQKLLTCQMYTDKEGFRQQQLLAIIPRHHKHYMLPSALAAKTLSWHLASETKSTLKGSRCNHISTDLKTNGKTSDAFNMLDGEKNNRMKPAPASSVAIQTLGVIRLDSLDGSKPLTQYRSFDNPTQMESVRGPVRSKSMLSSFFAKQKTPNLKTNA
ncbi:hypothetical protein BUALT_Bualt01G0234300 [Buddleja alternifolia]|uniref:ABIL1-like protein n=1 Tax=Buddleja alternifolia TaxID=168488 RepID=A0AAV6YB44_9LAMI|nr:hypothetical protein BUALT_Bualt01G0234300 [Buddleja alternifolia]